MTVRATSRWPRFTALALCGALGALGARPMAGRIHFLWCVLALALCGSAVAQPDADAPMRSRAEYVLFGPLGEESYRRYAPAAPNDPEYAILKIRTAFGRRADDSNAVPRADRARMWALYQELMDQLATPSEEPVLEQVYTFVKRVNPLAAEQLTERPTGLGLHLSSIRAFCNALYCTPEGRSRFPHILTDRQALVLAELAAPLHDSLKYLGSFKAQLMPDHEIVTAELVRRTFTGHTVIIRGQRSVLTAEDVDLVASTIGDHENIEKEAGRTDWLRSPDVRRRAKALFFVADVLTGAIVEDAPGCGRFHFDASELDARFVDLYFRHIDPVKGKIFRPEWGLDAMRDLGTTLGTLVSEHGLELTGADGSGTPLQTMQAAARAGLERALAADTERWAQARAAGRPAPEKFLAPEQLARVRAMLAQLPAHP